MTGPDAALPRAPHVATLVLLTGLSALSMNMFLPSLPGMAVDFGVPYAVMQLAVTGYLAASAVLQLVIGPLSDRYGRRPVMLTALTLFGLATLGAMLATSVAVFLACRLAQAVIAAGMVIPRAVIRDTTPPERAASLIGYVTMFMSVVPMFAPAIGGMLDETLGWRANFALLAACTAAVGVLALTDLRETAPPAAGGFAALLRGAPVLLGSARFWGYCLAATFSSGAFFAYLGGAPYVGRSVFGMSPREVGIWFAAPSIGYLLGNFLSGRYAGRLGIDRMVRLGAVVTAATVVAALALDLLGGTGPLAFFAPIAVMGIGNGLLLPSANAGVMSVRPELAGSAAGLSGAMIIAGGAGLATVAGAVLSGAGAATPLLAVMAASALAAVAALGLLARRL